MNKSDIKARLAQEPQMVTFVKVDGSLRNLLGTLNMAHIGRHWSPAGGGTPEPDNIVRVWDLENQGWRSFKVDTVTSVRPLSANELLTLV